MLRSIDALPTISQSTAVLLVLFFTFLYVAPFYISPSLRTSSRLPRNDPTSIRARTRSVYLTCFLTTCITLYILTFTGQIPLPDVPILLGLWPVNIVSTLRVQALVATLFAAPLYEHIIVNAAYKTWSFSSLTSIWTSWPSYRNLIVGPVSEEYIFRALGTSLFLLSHTPGSRIVYLSPMVFGLAHMHHFNEGIASCKDEKQSYFSALCTPGILLPALIRTTVQFCYTSLFGVFETFVLLRTGDLYACVLTHTFCNWLGLPRFWGRVGRAEDGYGDDEVASDQRHGKRHDARVDAGANTKIDVSKAASGFGVWWTVMYYVLLLAGTVAFAKLLWPLTESDHALVRL